MTLYVPRDADTVPGKVCKIVEILGDGDVARGVVRAAELTGKSPNTVRGWMNPDRDAEPGLSSAKALDAAYFVKTGNEPPLLKLYEDMISTATSGAHGTAKLNLWREMADLHITSAEVPRAVKDATHPDGPGGAAIVPHELATITHAVDRTKDQADRVAQAARQVALNGEGGR